MMSAGSSAAVSTASKRSDPSASRRSKSTVPLGPAPLVTTIFLSAGSRWRISSSFVNPSASAITKRAAVEEPILQRLGSEQAEQRHCEQAGAVNRHVGDGAAGGLPEQDANAIAPLRPQSNQAIRKSVGRRRDLSETPVAALAAGGDLDQRQCVRRSALGHRAPDVEARRDLPSEVSKQGAIVVARFQHHRSQDAFARATTVAKLARRASRFVWRRSISCFSLQAGRLLPSR